MQRLLSLPLQDVQIDAQAILGPCEWWRHTIGHGGINTLPLPARVVEGARKLQPRLIRIFLQEHFGIYPDHDQFHWGLLDPYMDALAATGAKVVAALTIKPKPLYPTIDHAIWRPNDVGEWQHVVSELAKRYSVEKPIVTHWEIGNETDIGESGGSPFLIKEPEAYAEFYRMAIDAILHACPTAKVGGPATCWVDNQPLPGLVDICRRTGMRLDFISWHLYSNDPNRHADGVRKAKALLAGFPGTRPEMLITEWSKNFEVVPDRLSPSPGETTRFISVEDMAYLPRRAAIVAASVLTMMDAGLDWSFYYHLWDQTFYAGAFEPFFSPTGLVGMDRHWNWLPHRFGLFGVNGEVRPQYFVYLLLSRIGEERLAAQSNCPDLRVLATRNGQAISAFMVNYNTGQSRDMVAQLNFTHLTPGTKRLTTYRIDADRRWSSQTLELVPLEQRQVHTGVNFLCQVLLPADSVVLLRIEPTPMA